MNFFNSIFADDDPDPPKSPNPESPSSSSSSNPTQTHQPESPITDGSEQVWSFGGLIKTLQVKSDWIDTYKRDLQEFGSGFKKETHVFREVASKSLDLGAAKAQVSLESVGQAIDTLGSIISKGKDSLLSLDNDFSDNINNYNNLQSVNNSSERKYSRFDAQLSAIQRDLSTFVEDPDDVDDYKKWKSGFNLKEKSEEIDGLLRDNGSVDGIYKRVVPETVDHDEFWCRYYYRVHRLKQAENVRAKLVKRAISTEDDEELSWDVDDEDEEDEEEGDVKRVDEGSVSKSGNAAQEEENENRKEGLSDLDLGVKSSVSTDQGVDMKDKVEKEEKSDVIESTTKEVWLNKQVQSEGTSEVKNGEELKKSEEKAASEGKEPSESGKDSDISVVSTQPSHEDDDMGWDEIEDVGSGDENKVAARSGSPNREELRKRLSAADDDEDLSWDIEDDD